MKKFMWGVTIFNVVLVAAALLGLAQQTAESEEGRLVAGMKAIAAGLAFLGGAVGTGIAQSRIGAAVMGAVAEDPKNFGTGLILVALPETLVILGFVVIFLI